MTKTIGFFLYGKMIKGKENLHGEKLVWRV